MEKIRKHILFFGRVQGVGFRWHSCNFANGYGLTGWVRNLDDGSVEMEVQGTEEKIDRLIMYLEQQNYVFIEDMKAENIPLESGEGYFFEH